MWKIEKWKDKKTRINCSGPASSTAHRWLPLATGASHLILCVAVGDIFFLKMKMGYFCAYCLEGTFSLSYWSLFHILSHWKTFGEREWERAAEILRWSLLLRRLAALCRCREAFGSRSRAHSLQHRTSDLSYALQRPKALNQPRGGSGVNDMKKTGTRTGDLFLMWVYFLLELRRNKNSVKLSQILRAEKETIQVCSVIPVNSNK